MLNPTSIIRFLLRGPSALESRAARWAVLALTALLRSRTSPTSRRTRPGATTDHNDAKVIDGVTPP